MALKLCINYYFPYILAMFYSFIEILLIDNEVLQYLYFFINLSKFIDDPIGFMNYLFINHCLLYL